MRGRFRWSIPICCVASLSTVEKSSDTLVKGLSAMAVVERTTKPLVDGERLTVDEFLRRWEEQPNLKLAELIEGVVYLPSPVGSAHGSHHFLTAGWLMHYSAGTQGCGGGNEGTWL